LAKDVQPLLPVQKVNRSRQEHLVIDQPERRPLSLVDRPPSGRRAERPGHGIRQ
jgi:hypothetical protein